MYMLLIVLIVTIIGSGVWLNNTISSNLVPVASAAVEQTTPVAGEKGTLVMGTSPDYPPYENVDAKNNGEIVGMDIDIAKHIAEQLGYKLEIASMDFNGLVAALQTTRVDFVMSAMSVTDDRKKNVDFSSTYYVARNTSFRKRVLH